MTTRPGQTQVHEARPCAGLDPSLEEQTRTQEQAEKVLYCRECQREITRPRFALSVAGSHEHTFRNPAGYSFHVLCFSQADGALRVGEPTPEASWFAGTSWCFAVCAGCGGHLGWWYSGGATGPFAGLIATRLIR